MLKNEKLFANQQANSHFDLSSIYPGVSGVLALFGGLVIPRHPLTHLADANNSAKAARRDRANNRHTKVCNE